MTGAGGFAAPPHAQDAADLHRLDRLLVLRELLGPRLSTHRELSPGPFPLRRLSPALGAGDKVPAGF